MSEPRGAASIVAWIGQTVERYGNSVAATGVGETLTFEELWTRSQRLARELVASGVRPEDRVGIWAEQSSDLLVGFVGIMAAGAAYVPLDPSYPRGRLERIAADSGMRRIVRPAPALRGGRRARHRPRPDHVRGARARGSARRCPSSTSTRRPTSCSRRDRPVIQRAS